MKKFLATLAVLVVPVAATAPQAFAASSNLWGGALHWSNTYKFVNPPSSWLSTSWKGFGISVPADATVTANAKVLEVSIPSSQEPLVVRFRTHSVPRTVKISRDGGMQVTHGSVSAIDKIDEFDAFLTEYLASFDHGGSRSVMSSVAQIGSGLGAWRNRPARQAVLTTDKFSTVDLTTFAKPGGKPTLIYGAAGGSPYSFAERGNDAWLVINTIQFNDGLAPSCRYPDGRACFGKATPPPLIPSSVRKKLNLPSSPRLKVDTSKKRPALPAASVGVFQAKFVTGEWNYVGDLIQPGTYSGFGPLCTIDVTDAGYKDVARVDPRSTGSTPVQVVATVKAKERIKSSCDLTTGLGDQGDTRTRPGVHAGLRPGLYQATPGCRVGVREGEDILRGAPGSNVPLENPTSPFRISTSVAVFDASCGTVTRVSD